MTEIKKIQNKIDEIIYNQAGDIAADNGFSADLQTSLKVYHLWKLALQENKLLILDAGQSYRLSKKEYAKDGRRHWQLPNHWISKKSN